MDRAICALVLIAAVATTAAADPPRARIVRRDTDGKQHRIQPHRVSNPSMQSQFLNFDGPVTSTSGTLTQPRLQTHVVIVQRPVVEPAATVERSLAEQPVWPHMIEVFLLNEGGGGSNTIYLDPDTDYENQGHLTLDRDHFINRAQRMANQLRSRPARVIWGARHTKPTDTAAAPAFILERPRPDQPRRQRDDADNPKFARNND